MVKKTKSILRLWAAALLAGAAVLPSLNQLPVRADENQPAVTAETAEREAAQPSSSSETAEPSSGSDGPESAQPDSSAGDRSAAAASSSVEQVANIGSIQGESQVSPYKDKQVQLSNVVVTKTDRYGFYIQDLSPDGNDRTSDALYVISSDKVAVGDQLTLEGQVQEGYMEALSIRPGQTFREPEDSLTVTQLVASKLEKTGTAPLPAAVDLVSKMPQDTVDNDVNSYNPDREALDYWESLEGMLVSVKTPRVLGPQYRGDIYVLPSDYQALPLNNIGGLNLRPNAQNTVTIPVYVGNRFIAKAKDYFKGDITGVVTYRSKIYKLEPNPLPDLEDGGLERQVSPLYPSEDKLTIASYNIENFSANAKKGETPEDKVTKIANSFIHEIHSPDIISLIEVQDENGSVNDGTTSGVKSGEKLAARIKELGGKDYKYTEVAPLDGQDGGKPGSNIRVAFLYNPDRVKLVDNEAAASNEAATFVDGHLIKNPARIAPTDPAFTNVRKSLAAEFEFKGQPVLVIANHLKSKIGDDAVYGSAQPAVQHTQAARVEQAKLLNSFVQEGLRQNPNLKFVLTGDFNDFEFSETAAALAGDSLVNLMLQHDAADRYSYFYRGSNQSLDNIFVSKNVADKAVFAPVHINASFMEEHGRASDHDPVVVQLDFAGADQEATPSQSSSSSSSSASTVSSSQSSQSRQSSQSGTSQTSSGQSSQTSSGQSASQAAGPGSSSSQTGDRASRQSGGENQGSAQQTKANEKKKALPATGQTSSGLALLGLILLFGNLKLKKSSKS